MAPFFIEPLVFYALAALLILGALAVVLLPRIIHAALSLVLFFVAIAGVFILLHAEFIAAAQVIIYAGAITVLVLFAVMLTQRSQSPESNPFNSQHIVAVFVAVATFAAPAGRPRRERAGPGRRPDTGDRGGHARTVGPAVRDRLGPAAGRLDRRDRDRQGGELAEC